MARPGPIERQAALETATESMVSYVITMAPWYDFGRHHLLLTDTLEKVERGIIKRLMIAMPPRHGKSQLASAFFPAYYLGRNPDRTVMIASYGADLAYDFSRQVREQIEDVEWPFHGVGLQPGRAQVKQFGVTGGRGSLAAAGIGGALTGKGAHLFIIDDPVKDREQADSEVYRERAWSWYSSVARTRLAPGGAVVVIQTRWHHDDLSGRLIEKMIKEDGQEWTILSLPARAYAEDEFPEWAPGPDPLGREPGEPLWPQWFDDEALAEIESEISIRDWEALYQQRPSAEGGLVFKRAWMGDRYQSVAELDITQVIVVVDGAYKEGINTSYSCVAVWGKTPTHMCLLDVWRDRVGYEDLYQASIDMWNRWNGYVAVTPMMIIEAKASGMSLISSIESRSSIPVTPFPDPDSKAQKKLATTSKEARADSATVPFKAGRIRLPETAPWLRDWMDEHLKFPGSVNDDQVDTTSMAMAVLFGIAAPAGKGSFVQSDRHFRDTRGNKGSSYDAPRSTDLGRKLGARGEQTKENPYNAKRRRFNL